MKSQVKKKKKSLYWISLLRSQGGNFICAWPFQGSAVWLDGCFRYHLLQPWLHVRNQSGLGSQSNMEYWKGYSSTADCKLFWTGMVINIPILMLMTEIVIRTDEAGEWILSFWQRSDGKWLNLEVGLCQSSLTVLPVYNPVNWLRCHEWGSCWHKSGPGVHLPSRCSGTLFTIIIAFCCAFCPLSYFYMAFENEIGFWNIGSFIFH